MADSKRLSKRIIEKVAQSAAVNTNRLHVLPVDDEKWMLRKKGAEFDLGIFDTRDDAVRAAIDYVNNDSDAYAVVHDRNGSIAETINR